MSVIDETNEHEISGWAIDRVCFYCNRGITLPIIEWDGHKAGQEIFETIWLHPECAVEFTIRILRDVHEYECKYEKRELLEPKAAIRHERALQRLRGGEAALEAYCRDRETRDGEL